MNGIPATFPAALADVLSLGLPYPRYIELHPDFNFAVFQFGGADDTGVTEVGAWAATLGLAVDIDATDPEVTWFSIDFTRSGVKFHAYAAPDTAAACNGGR